MWRSFFLAIGIMAIIVGAECLIIDSAQLYSAGETRATSFINPAASPASSSTIWRPKEWLPWLMLAGGTITILYAFTLPKRFSKAVA